MTKPGALVFVQSTRDISTAENSTETADSQRHAPSDEKLPLSSVLATAHFIASDDQSPNYLSTYELSDLSILESQDYPKAPNADVKDEPSLPSTHDRRVYRLISDKRSAQYSSYLAECKTGSKTRDLQHVSIQPKRDGEVSERDFNDWYEEEHVPLIAFGPGWLRSSRWELASSNNQDPQSSDSAGGGESAEQSGKGKQVAKYLAIHEFEDIRLVGSNQMFMATLGTDWREEVMANVDKSTDERRMWKLSEQI